MIYNNKFSSIIRTSKDIFYRFYINQNKNLILEQYNSTGFISNVVFKQGVIDYSVDIDENDVAHVLYLSSDGNLRYSIFPHGYEDKTLTTFDLRNNNVSFLSLKLLSSDIHIFYMLGNKLNTLQWSIFHYSWHQSKWSSRKISDVTTLKYIYPFFIESDSKNNLYLFYSKNSMNTYSIKKYSSDFNIWLDLENNLLIEDASNISFFISDKDMALISYNQSINKSIQTFIKYKDLSRLNSTWSDSLLLSNSNSIRPSVFTKNNSIYVMWEEGNNIVYRKTSDINLEWSEKKVLTNKNDYIINSVYISNSPIDSNFKNTYIYITINTYPNPIINMENQPSRSESSTFFQEPYTRQHNSNLVYTKPFENDNASYLNNYTAIISEKDNKIEEFTKVTSQLTEQLNTLSLKCHEKDQLIQKLSSELKELNLKYNNDMKNYNATIEKLNEEKKLSEKERYSYIAEMDKKFNEVTTQLNQDLNSKITALQNSQMTKQKRRFLFFK